MAHNAALEALLLDRNLVGLPFRQACRAASVFFLQHLADDLEPASVAELVILSKGLAYQISDAFAEVFRQNLPMNLIATRRSTVHAEDASIEVAYKRFDAGGDRLLIGDTVASGATICAALDEYSRSHKLRAVTVLSYAGSVVGAERITTYCQSRGIGVSLVYGLAAFGLASNGFDLSFLDPATVAEPQYIEHARGLFLGKAVSAVGWDFGSQSMAPLKYTQLAWLEAQRWGLDGNPAFDVARRPDDLQAIEREAPDLAS